MMPFLFSERLPLPSIKSYFAISFSIFVAAVLYGKDLFTTSTPDDWTTVLLDEPFLLWSGINMAYCCLVLCGKVIQIIVLGDLRLTETQHLQDKFWNFVFYKVIFVFGVVNVSSLHEALCWAAWFSVLGFCHMIGQMCKDRYEYITSSPATPMNKHIKLYSVFFCLLTSSILLSLFAIYFDYYYDIGISFFAFMMAECFLLGLKALHVLVKYTVQLADFSKSGVWDIKAKLVYYCDLIWSNVFLSMASLVLYWNVRALFMKMGDKILKHKIYQKILKNVATKFPLATDEELENLDDHCAICWDNMETARKLPCGHFFHHACLCSWLLQDSSCPTCRSSLALEIGVQPRPGGVGIQQVPQADNLNAELLQGVENPVVADDRNYFFYLDGQRIANWFPSFSIEVFHGRGQDDEQELENMAQQLTGMFPHISREAIVANLRITRSLEATADNILEGNLPINTATPEETPPVVIQELDERPANGRESTSSSQTSLSPSLATTGDQQQQQPPSSDYESNVEESSGAEDKTSLHGSDVERKISSTRSARMTTNVRKRFSSKSRNTTPDVSTDTPLQYQQTAPTLTPFNQQTPTSLPSNQQLGSDITPSRAEPIQREDRRQKMLEAIQRRQRQVQEPT